MFRGGLCSVSRCAETGAGNPGPRAGPARLPAAPCRPAANATFYAGTAAVLVPTFNDPNDRAALGILSELFRDRPVVGIHAVDLVWGFGTLHCLTQQQPAIFSGKGSPALSPGSLPGRMASLYIPDSRRASP